MTNKTLKLLIEEFIDTTRQDIQAYDDAGHRNKELFHMRGKALLKFIAKDLGYVPGECDIRSNKSGVAGSGEITLHTEDLYIQLSQSCGGGGLEVLYRTCKNRQDYCGGSNNWLSFIDLRDYQRVIRKFGSIRKAPQRLTY